jgi:hypothetical protein
VREDAADADDDARIAAMATNSLPFTTTTAPHSQAPGGTHAAMAEAKKRIKIKTLLMKSPASRHHHTQQQTQFLQEEQQPTKQTNRQTNKDSFV